MADYKNGPENGGVYPKIQELIAGYISSLETNKIEENKQVEQRLEELKKMEQQAIQSAKRENDELVKLELKKQAVSKAIADAEAEKELKVRDLSIIAEQLVVTKKEVDALLNKQLDNTESLAAQKRMIEDLGAKKAKLDTEMTQLNVLIREKTSSGDLLSVKNTQLEAKIKESEQKLAANSELLDRKMEESRVLLAETEASKQIKIDLSEQLKKAREDAAVELIEIDVKTKAIEADLKALEKQMEDQKKAFASEKQAMENEQLFIKQMNELNAQKYKEISYIKVKMKEILTKLSQEVEGQRALEFKNLLFIVDKL